MKPEDGDHRETGDNRQIEEHGTDEGARRRDDDDGEEP